MSGKTYQNNTNPLTNFRTSENKELINIAFAHINGYKKARATADRLRREGKQEQAVSWELTKFREIDGLELALRAIQKGLRTLDEDYDESNN